MTSKYSVYSNLYILINGSIVNLAKFYTDSIDIAGIEHQECLLHVVKLHRQYIILNIV